MEAPNVYADLRQQAFKCGLEAKVMHIDKPTGIIMDWNLGEGVATLVAFDTGDASLYLSTGGGVIGGEEHETVRFAVADYLAVAESFLDKAEKTEDTSIPPAGKVSFYILAMKNPYILLDDAEKLGNRSSNYSSLFEAANRVITELRMTTTNQ